MSFTSVPALVQFLVVTSLSPSPIVAVKRRGKNRESKERTKWREKERGDELQKPCCGGGESWREKNNMMIIMMMVMIY